jgi:hypothetical protein
MMYRSGGASRAILGRLRLASQWKFGMKSGTAEAYHSISTAALAAAEEAHRQGAIAATSAEGQDCAESRTNHQKVSPSGRLEEDLFTIRGLVRERISSAILSCLPSGTYQSKSRS